MNKHLENIHHDCGIDEGEKMASEQQSSNELCGLTDVTDILCAEGDELNVGNTESSLRKRKGKIISCAKETIENASRQLRRKVPYAGHLMTPRRLWLNKIPTQCDVVIEFPENAPDEALHWLLARIRSQSPSGLELVVQVRAHESTRRNAFYISAPMNVLFKAAEEARLPKRLRPDLGGALREFTTRESHCFQQLTNNDGSSALFTSQERQWLVLQVLQGLRAGQTDIEALQGRAAVIEGQSIIAAWLDNGLITQIFPLHETQSLMQLQKNWVKQIFAPQPLDDIAEYFGVKVALYFAWLGHYTCALGVPAVLGTMLYCVLWGKGQTAKDLGHVIFSLFNVAWASLYLEAWKRYSVELAFRWGTLSTPPELLEPPRPLYKGPLVENNLTGRLEPKEAAAWKQHIFRYFISFPIIGFCLFLVFVVMFLMLRFQDWLDQNNIPNKEIAQSVYNLHKDWWDSKLPEDGVFCCLSVIPKVLLAGAITLMDEAYYKLAVWLNDQENYRLQSKYENHLIAKVALFQFVNSFLSLFYIAFYLRDEDKLKEQLAGLLISRQIIGNLRESAVPYILEQWKLAKLSFNMWGALSPTQDFGNTVTMTSTLQMNADDSLKTGSYTEYKPLKSEIETTKRNIGQAEIESSLYKYDGTFSDHLEMLVQMGYVVLFSAAFPLAGVCALINNLMEIRSDAFKLAHVHQRPFGQRVANIGTWQNALTVLSLAAVIVNCALIGLSGQVSRLWPGLTTAQTIVLIVALEHFMLGLRTALTWLLPELPSWLAAEIARAEHCRREMQCKGTSPRPTPPSPASTIPTQPTNADSASTNEWVESQMGNELYRDKIHQSHSGSSNETRSTNDIPKFGLQRNIEADVFMFENREESSPDSPPSQISTILIRPLLDTTPPNSGASSTSMVQDIYFGTNGASASSASTSVPYSRQSMHIQEIPPFRKKSNDSTDHTGSSASSSPQRSRQLISTTPPQFHTPSIPEIPPYKPHRTSTEITPHLQASELTSNSDASEILKPAPSWSNITMKSTSQQIAASSSSFSTEVTSTQDLGVNVGKSSENSARTTSKTSCVATLSQEHVDKEKFPSLKSQNTGNNSTSHVEVTEDQVKAAELAAKKSRLKQKLVKSARSVGIFSLKLKERRQREAEKAASIAIEHAKALAKLPPIPQPGGELSLIPIEQLIQIEDIISTPMQKTQASTSSTAATALQQQSSGTN